MLWQYIGANFAESPRSKIIELLGYSATQVSSRLRPKTPEAEGVTAEMLAEKMADLGAANVSYVLVYCDKVLIFVTNNIEIDHYISL